MSNHELISPVFSSVVKTSAIQVSEKKKNTTKMAPVAAAPLVAAATKAPLVAAATKAPLVAAAEKVSSVMVDPEGGGWIEVSGSQKKKGAAALKRKIIHTKNVSSSVISNNSFYVPTELQKYLHKQAETKKKSVSKSLKKKIIPSKSFLALMTPVQPTKKSQKKKKSKKSKNQETPPVESVNQQDPNDLLPGSSEAQSDQEDSALLCLPYHVLTGSIMPFLLPEDIASFAQCNTASKRIGEDGYLWKSMFRSQFPSNELSPRAMKEWKLAYQLTLEQMKVKALSRLLSKRQWRVTD